MTRLMTGALITAWLMTATSAGAAPPMAPGTLGEGSGVPASQMPGPLKQVGYDQHLGEQIPGEALFVDEMGRSVRLQNYFGHRPIVLAMAYYECPMLCSMVLQAMVGSLKPLKLEPGRDFDVVVVSIDPGEGPRLAAATKREMLSRYGRPETAKGWHFLTGSKTSIDKVASAVGFRYSYMPERDEYAHAAGISFLTPQGKISRYLLGIEYAPRDVRLALVESSENKIGSLVDQALLYCFHYDPVIGRYSAVTMTFVRLAGALTAIGIFVMVVMLRRRENRETRTPGPVGVS
ncbi:MAG TPA: SCO family protein [Thermoanaerobaculia bacterium]|nr:SCO family protein [Thermoanaerobaculia bacterium]